MALASFGEKFSGCTIHYVDSTVDLGPVILRARVPIKDGDTKETLQRRILVQGEHRDYSKAIQLHADERIFPDRLKNRVFVDMESEMWNDNWMHRQQAYLEYQSTEEYAMNNFGVPSIEFLT